MINSVRGGNLNQSSCMSSSVARRIHFRGSSSSSIPPKETYVCRHVPHPDHNCLSYCFRHIRWSAKRHHRHRLNQTAALKVKFNITEAQACVQNHTVLNNMWWEAWWDGQPPPPAEWGHWDLTGQQPLCSYDSRSGSFISRVTRSHDRHQDWKHERVIKGQAWQQFFLC